LRVNVLSNPPRAVRVRLPLDQDLTIVSALEATCADEVVLATYAEQSDTVLFSGGPNRGFTTFDLLPKQGDLDFGHPSNVVIQHDVVLTFDAGFNPEGTMRIAGNPRMFRWSDSFTRAAVIGEGVWAGTRSGRVLYVSVPPR
jgi:hypothetical protein